MGKNLGKIRSEGLPIQVSRVTKTLEQAGFQAELVGGCVRDLLLGKSPKDWDVATDAIPEQITTLFPKTIYENAFGTVTVIDESTTDQSLRNIEITPFRLEAKYSDKRHPDSVKFGANLLDDLARRDFTINAMSFNVSKQKLTDPHKGQEDLGRGIIRAVGNQEERFEEDPLRIMRGIRLMVELGFTLNNETMQAMAIKSPLLGNLAKERVTEEFKRIIMSPQPMVGIIFLQKIGAFSIIAPELEKGIGLEQNGDHKYDVWEHTLRALQHSADKNFPFHVRLAVLFHDIGKPSTRRWSEDKKDWTFYGHDVVGEKIASQIMRTNLRLAKKTEEVVKKLVRYHMFFTDIDRITLSAVRRIVRNVGPENVWDLMKVRNCDRIGMGRPKENPYRLRKYESMIEEAMRSPTSVAMLKISGEDVLRETGLKPGPKIGQILHALLEEALDYPEINTNEQLTKKAKEMANLSDEALEKLGKKGRERKEERENNELKEIRDKYGVK